MPPAKAIRIRGARTHNLRDLDLDLPREALTVVCGVSGSGKSSLVLDTLAVESRRRFLGTLPRRPGRPEVEAKPDVDRIEGLPPAVATGFTAREPGPRQTLGTETEITHALRALFARAARPHCPTCGSPISATPREGITARLLDLPPGARVLLLAPRGRGSEALADAIRDGFVRVRVDGGAVQRVEEMEGQEVADGASVEVVVDRLVVKPGAVERIASSVEQGLEIGGGVLHAAWTTRDGEAGEATFSDRPYCGTCERTWPRLSVAVFSSTSPRGACEVCEGRGRVPEVDPERALPRGLRLGRVAAHVRRYVAKSDRPRLDRALARAMRRAGLDARDRVSALPRRERARLLEGGDGTRGPGLLELLVGTEKGGPLTSLRPCPACKGARLAPYGRAATLAGCTLPDLERRTVEDLLAWLETVALEGGALEGGALEGGALEGVEGALAAPACADATDRLRFLHEVGLGYLAPARSAATLSGGELRRARLAAACAARMSGLLFLLDEPTAGLHPADRAVLRTRLRRLVEEGNTVVLVEHDPAVLHEDADYVVELGPGAGAAGGRVLDAGPAEEVVERGIAPIVLHLASPPPEPRGKPRTRAGHLVVGGACCHNLRDVDAAFPLSGLTCCTGVSGAGKSTLLLDVIGPAVTSILDRGPFPTHLLREVSGAETLERIAVARGAPPRHPRATPGSLLGVLPPVRRLFAATLDARTRGWPPSRFSRHVRGGRCEACRGLGEQRVALRDLAPVRLPCETCEGTGFHRDTLRVRVKGLSMADVLALPLADAATLFRDLPAAARPLNAAVDVGLGYVPLGEPTSRLSSGEALRLRLAAALGRGGHRSTLYLLDEPSAGLHPTDVEHLTAVLLKLGEAGNTVVAVEHNLHVVRHADHVVELGPGPGADGGRVLYSGPPAGLLDPSVDVPTARALRDA